MNMKDNPNSRQLRSLLFACNDLAGTHILWVNRSGEVHITPLGTESSVQWVARMETQVRFLFEVFEPGHDYVGLKAANNDEYVSLLWNELSKAWNDGKQGELRLATKRSDSGL